MVRLDGALGWNQLCPEVQALLPQIVLIREANEQHTIVLRQCVTMSVRPLATQGRAKEGKLYLCLVTVHTSIGWQAQRVYLVRSRRSGCVKDVTYQDL